jgi:hypothetical protein
LKWHSNGTVAIGYTGAVVPPGVTEMDAGGIDVTPNGYCLFVAQGVMTEQVKVALRGYNDWADYVFDSTYSLKPISEVADYVKANKHLPDFPSADQVCDEGINLGKMDAKLLQKIEELTLYVINLQQQVDALKSAQK